MTTDLLCRCGQVIDVRPAGNEANVFWLVLAPNASEGFAAQHVASAHRLHECPKCKRLVYVDTPGVSRTLTRDV